MATDENSEKSVGPESFRAFWSYVHEDDSDEGGRIAELSRLVANRVRLLTGADFPIFLDRDGIEWGQQWEMTIDDALEATKFFIPILTPSYFQSTACRSEILKFITSAKALGLKELILPIYYIEIPDFGSGETSTDELVEVVKAFQYENWQSTALEDVTSSVHRKAVDKLAKSLKNRAQLADSKPAGAGPIDSGRGSDLVSTSQFGAQTTPSTPLTRPQDRDGGDDADDEPGVIDIMADGEAAMTSLGITINKAPAVLERLTKAAQDGVDRIAESDKHNKGFAGRLVAARRFAEDLEKPAEEINEIASDFLRDLLKVDLMIRVLAKTVEDGDTGVDDVSETFNGVRQLAEAAEIGLGAMEDLASTVVANTKWAKDLKKPSRRLVEGLRQMADARVIFRSWNALLDEVEGDGASPSIVKGSD